MLRKFIFTSTFATASCKVILVLTLNSIKKTQCEDNVAIAIRIPLICSVENVINIHALEHNSLTKSATDSYVKSPNLRF